MLERQFLQDLLPDLRPLGESSGSPLFLNKYTHSSRLPAAPRKAFACGTPSALHSRFRASGARALCPGQEFYKAALEVRWPAEKVRPPREPASSLRFGPSQLAPARPSLGRFRPRLSVGPPLLLPNCCRPSAPLRTRCEPLSCKVVGAFVQGGHHLCGSICRNFQSSDNQTIAEIISHFWSDHICYPLRLRRLQITRNRAAADKREGARSRCAELVAAALSYGGSRASPDTPCGLSALYDFPFGKVPGPAVRLMPHPKPAHSTAGLRSAAEVATAPAILSIRGQQSFPRHPLRPFRLSDFSSRKSPGPAVRLMPHLKPAHSPAGP